MWANKYVGIPFKANGRNETGLDCWGLVRLVYKNEYGINVPSFADEYDIKDETRISELIAQYREGWTTCGAPEPGSVVLFRIFGETQHVGISIDAYHFLHVRENSDTAIEKLNNPKWSKRIVGYYKYTPNKTDVVLNAIPHPLKTERITLPVPNGTSVEQIYDWIQKEYTTSPELVKKVNILINGRVIPRDVWSTTFVKDSDTLEYRAVAGKSAARLILTLAVMYIAFQTGMFLTGAEGSIFGNSMAGAGLFGSTTGVAGFGNFVAASIASATIAQVGMRIIDKLAPIRSDDSEDPGNTKAQYLFSGGSNQANRYGAIPVILGKVRMTPPLGANIFVDYERKNTSYLNMMLVWGYGPLRFYEDTFKIGDKPLTNFYDLTKYTITGEEPPGDPGPELDAFNENLENFNKLYPEDLEQKYSGAELAWEGTPDPDTGGLTEEQLEKDEKKDWEVLKTLQPTYTTQDANYVTSPPIMVSPGSSTSISLTQPTYGMPVIVEYTYVYDYENQSN